MRESGILLPISSLSSDYGVGSLGKKAYEFVDFLLESKQKYWQILPLGPTGYGDSPYQSFSSFAGNPYFIDIDFLIKDGLLQSEDAKIFDFGSDLEYIDYEKLFQARFKLLKIAYKNFDLQDKNYLAFIKKNDFWLKDYALFMAIKEKFDMVSFQEWDDDIRLRKRKTIEKLQFLLKERVDFYKLIQFLFYEQWDKLKKYANEKGIKFIGDIPIYVSPDSAELWASPKLFQVDKHKRPSRVAGCPPDAFTEDGQLWGNPLYDWDYHIQSDFKWWKSRLNHCKKIYDVLRIDHFRGFESYYSIKAGAKNARKGSWVKGPAYHFIDMLKKNYKKYPIIAEDLGYMTKEVIDMLKYSELPGMKVLQFAFGALGDNDYLPHNYTKNSVVYTGTHDNTTSLQWIETASEEEQNFAMKYLGIDDKKLFVSALVKTAMASPSDTCIIPMQDYLELGEEARMNFPGLLGGNWQWRLTGDMINDELAKKIADITEVYCRYSNMNIINP
ncbi:MAG: 4-alpha-glucanotransferase [Clostridia bacterium]